MEIKAEQLEKDIEAIPGVCGDAKKAIKKLFENNFGVKFKNAGFEPGKVYKYHINNEITFVVAKEQRLGLPQLKMVDLNGSVWWPEDDGILFQEEFVFVADSLEEYFRKKFNGTL